MPLDLSWQSLVTLLAVIVIVLAVTKIDKEINGE